MIEPLKSDTNDQVPILLIGTRFQAMMALGIIRHANLAVYDLVVFLHGKDRPQSYDLALLKLIGSARKVQYIDRWTPKLQFIRILNRALGPAPRTVLTAAITHPFILAPIRLRPSLRLETFDEGSYNVAPNGPFFAPPPRRIGSFRQAFVWLLFRKGPLAFAHARSQLHYTAFPPSQNYFADRAVQVHVHWGDFALPEEVAQAQGATRIMVLPCMKDFRGSGKARQRLMTQARSCDLVVRHPRDDDLSEIRTVALKSPIEGIVCALAAQAPITVLHYGSTVRLTLEGRTGIDLLDLSQERSACQKDPVA